MIAVPATTAGWRSLSKNLEKRKSNRSAGNVSLTLPGQPLALPITHKYC